MFKVLGLLGLAAAIWWFGIGTGEPQVSSQTTNNAISNLSSEETSAPQTEVQVNETDSNRSKSLITDFNSSTESDQWRTVNDTVMGGISQSSFSITPEGIGVFSGSLSLENNGGFSSVRREISAGALSGMAEIALRIKADGRPYQLRLKMNSSNRAPSYRAEFDTQDGEWITVTLPISTFEPVFRGRIVEDAPVLIPEEVVEMGFLLADNQSGEFEIAIDWIRAE
ncbi:MAG: CIA30 family protein [Cyanobacteria bacterium J06621_11]